MSALAEGNGTNVLAGRYSSFSAARRFVRLSGDSKASEAEEHDSRPVVQELQDLYMLLETGKITEQEFDKQETVLLERLERTERDGQPR